MPLEVTCDGCGRTLILEDVFQGAHCRCQFCRHLQSVPAAERTEPAPRRKRPEHPPLADEAEQSRMIAGSAQLQTAATARSWRTRWRRSPTILATIAAFLASILGISVWLLSHPNNATPNNDTPAQEQTP